MNVIYPPTKRPTVINFEKARQRERQRLRQRLLDMILRNEALRQAKPR